ncbi:unnamed protein product [Mytilus edulis]|uniref:Endonuclease/exonuclease/phosphatase domain-containing protein n=2 Tax=Mytilus edulis TaxID=6550 RepID=A0A8S3RV14_MYTED|nr:unnamed protein product [Mytilus edulis]
MVKTDTSGLKITYAKKINDLGPIWLYIWFSTCDLTTYNKGYIAITAHGTDAIDNTMQYYHKCIELIQTFDNCRVTILDTPVYSIYHWNKGKHKTPDNFITQDKELTEQVVQLNNKIKEINSTLNSHTPKFSNDLQVRSKYKNGAHRTETNRSYYNFQLYADGIHPTNLLARTWLKKIATQAQIDCCVLNSGQHGLIRAIPGQKTQTSLLSIPEEYNITMNIINIILLTSLLYNIGTNLTTSKTWEHQQLLTCVLNKNMSTTGRRPITLPTTPTVKQHLTLLLLILGGDIELNPGPRGKQQSIYPCGLCDHPVTWKCDGVCCDDCDIWHHRSCIELCTVDYELLQRSNVQWHCCKCESINVSSFTFHSYELNTSNYYEPLTHDISFESVSSSIFSPLKTSSPRLKAQSSTTNNTKNCSNKSRTQSSNVFNLNEKRNLRILTVNCRSIKDKTSEFKAAINYIKPDIICGTESWLKGEKPGKTSTKDAIKSSEVFPDDYNAYRNDRGTLGGGVFILVHKDIISVEQSSLVTNCEIEWVKIHLKGKKRTLIGSFYMPHRNMKCLDELEKSLQMIANSNTNIMLTGDFNCPDINWESMSVPNNSSDKEIQTKLMEITSSYQLTQIHEQPTREDNLLDIVLTTNPSLVKTSKNTPGISDHEMIVTDCDTKPYYQRSKPRKCYIYSKANWNTIKEEISITSTKLRHMQDRGTNVQEMSDTFKKELFQSMDKHIPSKEIRSKNNLPWINHKIRKLFKKKQRLYQQAKKTKKWSNYRQFQKEVKRQVRKAEYTYINDTIIKGLETNNTKPFWKYIKSRKTDNIGVSPLKDKGKLACESLGLWSVLYSRR